MPRSARLVIAFSAFAFAFAAHAQAPLPTTLSAQQHAPGLKWRQIVTPHFTVIFEDSMAADAQRAATLLERAYEPLTQTLGAKPERIPVLLAAQSLVPNAFVSWFPRRTMWNPLPKVSADFAGPVEWYNLLAVHEGRHVAQERHMRSGIIGFAARIFGDEATALLANRLYFPDWLWEGDAVTTETAMTMGGRGRQPAFMNRVRAMRLTGQAYPYYPAWFGSYRTYYPGHYELGYLLTSYARRTYGPDVWGKVIRRATRNPVPPLAVSMALAAETGHSLGDLHRAAVAEADSLWRAQESSIQETPATLRTRPWKGFHLWHWPQYTADGSIIAAYTDLDHITPLVRIDSTGREEVLVRHFPARSEFAFHVAADRVVWLENDVHPRWGELDYLTIKELDIARRDVRTIRARTRMYALALAPDGSRLAALEMTYSRASRLVILDATSGNTLRTYPNEANHFLTWPAWSDDGDYVSVAAIDKTRGNAIVRINLASGEADTLTPWTSTAIARLVEHRGRLYYGSPRNGIDNIYAVDLATRRQYQITSRKFAAYHADVTTRGGKDMLLFRDYGGDGDEIAEMELTAPEHVVTDSASNDVAAMLSRQERVIISADSATRWPVQRYGGWSRLFDVHSLALFPGNEDDPWIARVYSRNVLNTLGATLGYLFNPNRNTHAGEVGLSYARLPTILDAAVRVGSDASSYVDSTGSVVPYKWNERSATLTARLPLTTLRGLAVQRLLAAVSLGETSIRHQPVEFVLDNNNGSLRTLSYTLLASHAEPAAYRDLVGTGAFVLGRYRHTPIGGDYEGHTYLMQAGASVRGPIAHHGVSLVAALEEQRPTNYAYSSELPFARGYPSVARYRIWRAGASYALPLWYPDLAIGPLAFVRRVQAEGFGDYSVGYSRGGANKTFYRSTGVDVSADFHPLSINTMWRAGVRWSYRLDAAQAWRTQFFIQIR